MNLSALFFKSITVRARSRNAETDERAVNIKSRDKRSKAGVYPLNNDGTIQALFITDNDTCPENENILFRNVRIVSHGGGLH